MSPFRVKPNLTPPTPERKSVREWEVEFGVYVLDVSPDLLNANLSETEFRRLMATHSVLQRPQSGARPGWSTGTDRARTQDASRDASGGADAPLPHAPEPRPVPDTEVRTASQAQLDPPSNQRRAGRRWLWAFIIATGPALAVWLLSKLYRALSQRFSIAWYWLASVLMMDLLVLWLSPVSALISGPFFLWYLVADALGRGVNQAAQGILDRLVPLLHRGDVHPSLPPSFVETIQLAGNPLPVYFSIGQWITSSLVLATAVVAGRAVWRRLRLPIRER
ncbi:hypothetical protein [Alicyclobacillus kakegawensis]|uniref:hypothetical protein n=1 Tax=Alicyclobacillus kakegawensis TaxID=392012 RepID=UPI00082F9CAE|nr:hypothetical protein [Alicyclobacillus kakegawensis]